MIATPIRDLVIDVGANQGGFALEIAARNPGVLVLAFEPIPELCDAIAAKLAERKLDNVTLLTLAADKVPRTANFHVSTHDDCGVSSLLSFDQTQINGDEYWQRRKDLYFDRSIEVSVVRLDSIPEIQRAARIRFIKIDAQGVDLEVLESLGEHLARVEAGMLEVPATLESRLYDGETHDVHAVLVRLEALGFRLYALKPNDHAAKEFNVFFCRRDVDWRVAEQELQLRGIQLYDGKHFWHAPANRLMPDAEFAEMERIITRLGVVERALAKETAETRRLNQAIDLRERVDRCKGLPEFIGEEERKTPVGAAGFDLKALVTSGARILWVGRMPPLSRFEADPRLLESSGDFRMPPEAHQSYDLVYLVESDLGRMKAWPVVVDEALRLLRPGGVLVIRMTNTTLCSIFALKHQLFQWGGVAPLLEFTCEDGSTELAVRNSRPTKRPAGAWGFSFGVITDGKRRERLEAFMASVRDLDKAAGQEVELLVCGPEHIRVEVESAYPGVRFVADPGEFAEQGWITRKKNRIVDLARYENLIIAHDRYSLRPDFLRGMAQFGGDFGVAVCRQLRPDGRRYPDWVATGSQWSWSAPGMMAYGDWSPHIYINGGITIGKTEVLRRVRWNELLFWNQAEDVELSRRLLAQGLVPRFIRPAVAISHVVRPGTMESFAPLPVLSDRYHLPGPAGVTSEIIAPGLPYGQPVRFHRQLDQKPARLGLFQCEQWNLRADALELPAGVFGELGGRLPAMPAGALVITLTLAAPAADLEAIVNDVPVAVHFAGRLGVRLIVPPGTFATTHVFRMHLRVGSGTLRVRSLLLCPQDWSPGAELPTTRESLLTLGLQSPATLRVHGGALCVSDVRLLLRGARRIAVIVPDASGSWQAIGAFLAAMRAYVRSDVSIRLVGKGWKEAMPQDGAAFDHLIVDWARFGNDRTYFADREAAMVDFAPDLIINTQFPRALLPDLLVARSPALASVGFESAVEEANQEAFAAKYTVLLPEGADVSAVLCLALGIPFGVS